jgi:hypothetical protein
MTHRLGVHVGVPEDDVEETEEEAEHCARLET